MNENKTTLKEEITEKIIKVENDKIQDKIIIADPVVKITFKRELAYFVIYSFLGFIVETIFGILTKGVVESRKSCLFGPFCCIYGLGAAIMIPGLQKFKKSNYKNPFNLGIFSNYLQETDNLIILALLYFLYTQKSSDMTLMICLLLLLLDDE